jgi:hypothetical protein
MLFKRASPSVDCIYECYDVVDISAHPGERSQAGLRQQLVENESRENRMNVEN